MRAYDAAEELEFAGREESLGNINDLFKRLEHELKAFKAEFDAVMS